MTAEDSFDRLVDELVPAGAVAGKMFGARALTIQKKAFACLKNERIALKLGDGTPEHQRALAIDGAELWDPSGSHRPFKDWVSLPPGIERDLSELASSALISLQAALSEG